MSATVHFRFISLLSWTKNTNSAGVETCVTVARHDVFYGIGLKLNLLIHFAKISLFNSAFCVPEADCGTRINGRETASTLSMQRDLRQEAQVVIARGDVSLEKCGTLLVCINSKHRRPSITGSDKISFLTPSWKARCYRALLPGFGSRCANDRKHVISFIGEFPLPPALTRLHSANWQPHQRVGPNGSCTFNRQHNLGPIQVDLRQLPNWNSYQVLNVHS